PLTQINVVGLVASPPCRHSHGGPQIMAETKKLSVEKALNKIRADDGVKSRSDRRDEDMNELDEEIKRMRAQRLRLERNQRKRDRTLGGKVSRGVLGVLHHWVTLPGKLTRMMHCIATVAIVLAIIPDAEGAQNCATIPAGPARTDCYIGMSRLYQGQSDLAAG